MNCEWWQHPIHSPTSKATLTMQMSLNNPIISRKHLLNQPKPNLNHIRPTSQLIFLPNCYKSEYALKKVVLQNEYYSANANIMPITGVLSNSECCDCWTIGSRCLANGWAKMWANVLLICDGHFFVVDTNIIGTFRYSSTVL